MLRLTALALALSVPAVYAQSLPDWAAPSAPTETPSVGDLAVEAPPPPPPIPIDGGLGLLALAGAGLAARKLRRS